MAWQDFRQKKDLDDIKTAKQRPKQGHLTADLPKEG
jgi:hypothetical protein